MLITPKTHEVNMSYKYLTLNDRNNIEVIGKDSYSSKRIVRILDFHHHIISRKLKRLIVSMKLYIPK